MEKRESFFSRLWWEVGFKILLIFIFLFLPFIYFASKSLFWKSIYYLVVIVLVLLITLFIFNLIGKKRRSNILSKIFSTPELLEIITNFIDRFRHEGKGKEVSEWRNYRFDNSRLEDLLTILQDKQINIKNIEELFAIMCLMIERKEFEYTKKVVQVPKMPGKVNKFENLTGIEFEYLLERLFQKMGYQVELLGKVGDQGGDLRLIRDNQLILVQAKRYSGSVGNDAVQEVVSGRTYYNCQRSKVVTTGSFTKSAIELANANDVELTDSQDLKRLLLDNLEEIWE